MASSIDYSLYVILDAEHLPKDRIRLKQLVQAIGTSGATAFQYRAKGESTVEFQKALPVILRILADHGLPLLINDDLSLAIHLGAEGVHLGRGDTAVGEAREKCGEEFVIGATVHTVEEARSAIDNGANYLSVGSIYSTRTKRDAVVVGLDLLHTICTTSPIPTIAIGGIDENRVDEVLAMGASGIAVISAILDSRNPGEATRRLRERVDRFKVTGRDH